MTHFILTDRDAELIEFLAAHRECALTLLAERFFKRNPYSGEENRDPEAACQRRLSKLRREGYVTLDRVRERNKHVLPIVRLAARADSALGEAASRRTIAARDRPHHAKTLEAIRLIEQSLTRRGETVGAFRLENAIRSEAQRGRRTSRGDTFDAFPDAVVEIDFTRNDGFKTRTVAVEYVTSKYADKDIAAKLQSFTEKYNEVLWFADTPHTQKRVMNITGRACTLLP
jgi:hypothetical protein